MERSGCLRHMAEFLQSALHLVLGVLCGMLRIVIRHSSRVNRTMLCKAVATLVAWVIAAYAISVLASTLVQLRFLALDDPSGWSVAGQMTWIAIASVAALTVFVPIAAGFLRRLLRLPWLDCLAATAVSASGPVILALQVEVYAP